MSLFRLLPTPIWSRCGRPYPPPVVYVVRGCLYEQCAVTMTRGVGRTHGSSRQSSKDGGYGNISTKEAAYRVLPAAGDPKDRRRQTVPLRRLRPTSVLRSIRPRPQGRLKTVAWLANASERHALALHGKFMIARARHGVQPWGVMQRIDMR
jgi:hypothetical protein